MQDIKPKVLQVFRIFSYTLSSVLLLAIIIYFINPNNRINYFRDSRTLSAFLKFEPKVSFSQQGEDIIIRNMFKFIHKNKISYLDIGAWHPISDSNTYKFYINGGHGVLVEPNHYYVNLIQKYRPHDTVLEMGVGLDNREEEGDYFVVDAGNTGLNTFSAEQAKVLEKQGHHVSPEKRKLVPVNSILEKYFKNPPDLLSIDIEGLDFAVLKTLDFSKYAPSVIVTETLSVGTINEIKTKDALTAFLAKKGYIIRGQNMVNTIFIKASLLH